MKPKRGTIEHLYTAVPRSFIGHQDWRKTPPLGARQVTGEAIRTFVAKVGAAIDAGTIGWREETAEILDRPLRELMEVAAASRERLGTEDGIPVVTAMAAFEAPPS